MIYSLTNNSVQESSEFNGPKTSGVLTIENMFFLTARSANTVCLLHQAVLSPACASIVIKLLLCVSLGLLKVWLCNWNLDNNSVCARIEFSLHSQRCFVSAVLKNMKY